MDVDVDKSRANGWWMNVFDPLSLADACVSNHALESVIGMASVFEVPVRNLSLMTVRGVVHAFWQAVPPLRYRRLRSATSFV